MLYFSFFRFFMLLTLVVVKAVFLQLQLSEWHRARKSHSDLWTIQHKLFTGVNGKGERQRHILQEREGVGYINKRKPSDAEGWGNRQFKAGKQKEAVILKGVAVTPHHLQIPPLPPPHLLSALLTASFLKHKPHHPCPCDLCLPNQEHKPSLDTACYLCLR